MDELRKIYETKIKQPEIQTLIKENRLLKQQLEENETAIRTIIETKITEIIGDNLNEEVSATVASLSKELGLSAVLLQTLAGKNADKVTNELAIARSIWDSIKDNPKYQMIKDRLVKKFGAEKFKTGTGGANIPTSGLKGLNARDLKDD